VCCKWTVSTMRKKFRNSGVYCWKKSFNSTQKHSFTDSYFYEYVIYLIWRNDTRDTPSNSAGLSIHNFRSAALDYSSRIAIFFEHSNLIGHIFANGHINIFGSKRNTQQFLSSFLRIWITFSCNSITVGKNIYISNHSGRQLSDCVNYHFWTKPMSQKYQYLRSSKQSTCLKKPGCISCTVIPHCWSSKRKTSASAVAACLDMQ